jgi:16S rRNA (cytosine967-C5)-methyltransferase
VADQAVTDKKNQGDDKDVNSPAEPLRARKVSLDIISNILRRSRPMDQAIAMNGAYSSLPGIDRAFVMMLVSTTLRRLGQIDDFISRASDRKEPPNPPLLHDLLRIGAAQIAFMEVPDYAVVDTSVNIASEEGMERQKGLVNAVLRRIAREHREWLTMQDEVMGNIPDWMLRTWIEDYDMRRAADIGQASLSEAPLDISVKDPSMIDYWKGTLNAKKLPTGSLRRAKAGGPVFDLPGFDDGGWWVQDAASALPAKLFGDVSGRNVIDLCAAPGGKTAQLAAAGAQVMAIDRSANRLKILHENISRLGLEDSVTTEVADSSVWKPREKAEFILLDAPCSATGTVRRNPDILRLKSERDMDMLVQAQARLLDNAVSMMASGAILVYCTCSLQKAEGEHQISRILAENKSLKRLAVSADEVGGLDILITDDGDVRVLPFHQAAMGGMDGFYIARLQMN